jgi:hypothetical protein
LWHLWQIWKGHVEAAVIEQHHKHGPSVSTPGPCDRDRPSADSEY